MDTPQDLPKATNVQFRVLIIGKANAGKTSILQRVCDTTERPEIYSVDSSGDRNLVQLNPTIERGEHDIEHEIMFSKHAGYVFHDSRGFEGGSADELKTVQDFVRHRSRETRLKDRLHSIWYCVPMDCARPSLELRYFEDICPDKNVPVIAVFTKFDQFKRDVGMKLEDQGLDSALLSDEMDRIFKEEFLVNLKGTPPSVRLERMHRPGQRCFDLIQATENALSSGVVSLMLLAVQKDNLELNINRAVEWVHSASQGGKASTEIVIKACILAFPSIWFHEVNALNQFKGSKEEDAELFAHINNYEVSAPR